MSAKTTETVRQAARATLLLAIERQEALLSDTESPLTLSELSQAVSALGRVALPAGDQHTGPVVIEVVRRAASARISPAETVDAEVLSQRLAEGSQSVAEHGNAPALPAPAINARADQRTGE